MKKILIWRLFILVLVLPVALGLMVNCSEDSDDGAGPGDGYKNPPAVLMGTWHLFGLIDVLTNSTFDASIIGMSVNMRMEDGVCRYTTYIDLDVDDTGIIRWRTVDDVEYMSVESDSLESDSTMETPEMEVVSYNNHLINMIGLFEDELNEDYMMHWLMAKGPGFYGMVAESGMLSPPIGGAMVTLEDNDGELASVSTDEYGIYSFPDIEPGEYTVIASNDGFETQSHIDVAQETDPCVYNFFLWPVHGEEFRLVLSWGENPQDLDCHLYTPEIEESTYHVYWNFRGDEETPPYATLDTNVTEGSGPETVTIYDVFDGTYVYFVYNYSEIPELAGSGATVRVYNETGQLYELVVPQPEAGEEGYLFWDVLRIVDGSIIIHNDIVAGNPGAGLYSIDNHEEVIPK